MKPRVPLLHHRAQGPKATCTSVLCVTTTRQAITTASGPVRAARRSLRGAFKVAFFDTHLSRRYSYYLFKLHVLL